jgi:uncharacterized protein (DUF1697 family)
MNTWIALFRGINVGGHNALPMPALRALLEKDGCANVRTYIQSGNAVFRSALAGAGTVEKRLGELVTKAHGFAPRVMVLTMRELEQAAAGNPFPEAETDPKSVHLFLLAETAQAANLDGLEAIRAKSERYALKQRVFYLHAPDGFGKSKLAERAERLLGVPATARNWRTVTALLEMAREP